MKITTIPPYALFTCKVLLSKCPPNRPIDIFYLRPLQNPSGFYWYEAQPIGYHKLNNTTLKLCTAVGVHGFNTNHFLRATAATHPYQASVDEQIIMETTGHRSTDDIRSYKRTNTQQKESVSDIPSLTKQPRTGSQCTISRSEQCFRKLSAHVYI